jgi:hypothetical protein
MLYISVMFRMWSTAPNDREESRYMPGASAINAREEPRYVPGMSF